LAVVAGLIVPSYIKWVVGGIGRKDFLGDFLIWEAKKTMRKTTNEEKIGGEEEVFSNYHFSSYFNCVIFIS
jgi:hypothetical protein